MPPCLKLCTPDYGHRLYFFIYNHMVLTDYSYFIIKSYKHQLEAKEATDFSDFAFQTDRKIKKHKNR